MVFIMSNTLPKSVNLTGPTFSLLTPIRVICITLHFFEEMREHNIHVIAIPSHTSHSLQPLDSTPFAQFKCNWQARLLEWNFVTGTKILVNQCFFEMFWPAWWESMSVGNIQSRFRKMGIFPMNMSAIPKTKFCSSTSHR